MVDAKHTLTYNRILTIQEKIISSWKSVYHIYACLSQQK